jgi:hypothetical protein
MKALSTLLLEKKCIPFKYTSTQTGGRLLGNVREY